jgi:uncharacterized membrane protein YbhN (UPF0104 family)
MIVFKPRPSFTIRVQNIISIGVLALLVAAIAWYLNTHPKLILVFKQISLPTLIGLSLMRLLFLGVNGLFLRAFVLKFGVNLNTKEWFGLSMVTTMGNYLTPFSGGMVARAAYLKKCHQLPYAQFMTLLASNYLINFGVIALVGVVTLVTFGGKMWSYWSVFVFFVVVISSVLVLIIFPRARLPWNNRIAKTVNTSLAGWDLVRHDNKLLKKLSGYTIINIILNSFSFWIAYDALGTYISYRSALLVSLLTSFSLLLRLTPGNLGIQEVIVGFSSSLLGVGGESGLLVAILIRAATLVWIFTLGPIFTLYFAQIVCDSNVN